MAIAHPNNGRMNTARFEGADTTRIWPRLGARGWSTTSASNAPDTSPDELIDLSQHADVCRRQRGRLFTVRCVFDTLRTFLAPRFVTIMLGLALLIGVLEYLR